MSKQIIFVTCLLIAFGYNFVSSNDANDVRLVNHRQYMMNLFSELAKTLEERGWCNLKLPEIEIEVHDAILDWQVNGTAILHNGFAVSIHRLEAEDNSFNSWWLWNNNEGSGTAIMTGTLIMHNLKLGFDLNANFNDENFHSTATILLSLITFEFRIEKNTLTDEITIDVNVLHPSNSNKLQFWPVNNATNVVRALYNSNSTFYGVTAWGNEVMQPIAMDLVTNVLQFPEVCYNCKL